MALLPRELPALYQVLDQVAHDAEPHMHVKLSPNGPWHCMRIDRRKTKCGKHLDGAYQIRDESYEGSLCADGCFSPHEFEHAFELREQAVEAQREANRQQDIDDLRKQEEKHKRFDFATGKFMKLVKPDPETE